MSRPLITDPKLQSAAANFHRDVFAAYGGPKRICALCGKSGATDAAHVLKRSHLGTLRYSDVRFARPAHRTCHIEQESNRIDFALEIRIDAVLAHNQIAKVKMVVPDA